MLKQLSIFAENKKGTMQQITQILFENDVNILGSVNNDSAEYGIVRMVSGTFFHNDRNISRP